MVNQTQDRASIASKSGFLHDMTGITRGGEFMDYPQSAIRQGNNPMIARDISYEMGSSSEISYFKPDHPPYFRK